MGGGAELAVDIASNFYPIVKAGKLRKLEKALDAVDAVNDASKVAKVADKANDASKATKAVDKASDASKAAKADVVSEVRFSDKFAHSKYKNQIAERGWDNKKIAETINNPIKTTKGYNKYTKSTVTNYYIDDIHYVAVDDSTGKVIQIADLTNPNWKGPR